MKENQIILGETPNGKEIGARIRPNTSHWELYFTSGGQLPKEWDSLYTSTSEAKQAMLKYLGSLEKAPKTSAKASS